MKLKSSAFKNGGFIPVKYTCSGIDVSPPVSWTDIPVGTKCFALTCEDADAPGGSWIHWVYYDIPPSVKSLPENVEKNIRPLTGGQQAMNDYRTTGYGGPCPPEGTHRYFFRLYALDSETHIPWNSTKKQLENKMKGHILEEATLLGRVRREKLPL